MTVGTIFSFGFFDFQLMMNFSIESCLPAGSCMYCPGKIRSWPVHKYIPETWMLSGTRCASSMRLFSCADFHPQKPCDSSLNLFFSIHRILFVMEFSSILIGRSPSFARPIPVRRRKPLTWTTAHRAAQDAWRRALTVLFCFAEHTSWIRREREPRLSCRAECAPCPAQELTFSCSLYIFMYCLPPSCPLLAISVFWFLLCSLSVLKTLNLYMLLVNFDWTGQKANNRSMKCHSHLRLAAFSYLNKLIFSQKRVKRSHSRPLITRFKMNTLIMQWMCSWTESKHQIKCAALTRLWFMWMFGTGVCREVQVQWFV